MALNDIYQCKMHFSHPAGEEALNVLYYRVASGGSNLTAEEVVNELVSNTLEEWAEFGSSETVCFRVSALNGMNNSDYYEANPNREGDYTATALAPFISVGFRSQWQGPGTRRSYHRFWGGAYISMNGSDGRWNDSALDAMYSMRVGLGAELENTEGLLTPIQIAGPFELGTSPSEGQSLTGIWEVNAWPAHQVTRRAYNWVAPAAPA